jgi:hypothetical protein
MLTRRRFALGLALAAPLALAGLEVGCAGINAANLKSDVTAFLADAKNVISWAQSVWTELPASITASLGPTWTQVVSAAEAAIQVAASALAAYEAAETPADWPALFAAILAAIDTVATYVERLIAGSGSDAGNAGANTGPGIKMLTPHAATSLAQMRVARADLHTFKVPGK